MVNWQTTAFIFPGQGSQSVGMGSSVAAAFPAARAIFDEADDILNIPFSKMLFEGPEADLNDTYNTQAALFVVGVATLGALQAQLPEATPAMAAGHSLGEFTALVAAKSLSFAEGLRLVRERGRLMKLAGETHPGSMAALLGLETQQVAALCEQAALDSGEVLVVANDNCPGQVVISGGSAAVDRALVLASESGAKRSVRLALSVAAHSPLMASASAAFREQLQTVTLNPPQFPIYANVSAKPITTVADIRQELELQILSPVRWTGSVQAMVVDGITHFVEIGSGEVLTGLVKRIERTSTRATIHNAETLMSFVESAHKN